MTSKTMTRLHEKYRNFLDQFPEEFYSIKFGEGTNPTIYIKVPDAQNKLRTITYFNHTGISIPANLYHQREYLNVGRPDIDDLFANLEALSRGRKFRYTEAKTLRILEVDWQDMAFLKSIYDTLHSFRMKCGDVDAP